MGLEGVPEPGDVLNVVENENRAREVADYRSATRARTRDGGARARALARSDDGEVQGFDGEGTADR